MRSIRTRLISSALAVLALAACSAGDEATGSAAGTAVSAEIVASSSVPPTVADVLAENQASHDEADDHDWDEADEVAITLDGDTATTRWPTGADEGSVSVSGSTVTISAPGTYRLVGSLHDGRIVVDSTAEGIVRLVLDGTDITSSSAAPIEIVAADKAVLVAAAGTENRLTSTVTGAEASIATIDSAADLTITGGGTLTVDAASDGINSKDGFVLDADSLVVTAADDGIQATDYVIINGGTATVTAGDDGIKADNLTDAARGYVAVNDGTIGVDAGGDGLNATTDVVILGGAITIASGDDAVHADVTLAIGGGTVTVDASYEALESPAIVIAGGDLDVTSSDDGLNGEGLSIAGGALVLEAGGDGIDINGPITMTGGTVVVFGPTREGNGALDYDGEFAISGGTIIAVGSSGMVMAPSSTSAQGSLLATFDTQDAASELTITSTDGVQIATITPTKAYASVAVSTPAIVADATYEVTVDGGLLATTSTADAVSTGMGGGGERGPGGGRPGG